MSTVSRPYEQGHLFVAALRLFLHQNNRPPSVREIGEMIGMSVEMGNYLCNRLAQLGVVDVVEAVFEEKVTLKNHLLLEELPHEEKASTFEDEIQKFKEDSEKKQEEIKKIQEAGKDGKKDLFDDLEKQLKEGLKTKKNPLDDLLKG